MNSRTFACVGLGLVLAAVCPAPVVNAAQPDAQAEDPRLGVRFTSKAGGISLRPLAGGIADRKLSIGSGSPIVTFFNEKEKWTLKVIPIMYDTPVLLQTTPKASGKEQVGLLDEMKNQTIIANPSVQILRKDYINVGPNDAGVLVSRYTSNLQAWLHQQAIIKSHPKQYYVIDLTTPSDWNVSYKADEFPISEQIAAELFDQVLRTVVIHDTTDVFNELNRRLDAGMTESINFKKRMEKAVIPTQYYRVVSTATAAPKDIGWLVINENREARYDNREGIRVSILSKIVTDKQETLKSVSDLFTGFNRNNPDESWVMNQYNGDQNTLTEFGETHLRRIRQVVTNTPADPKLSEERVIIPVDRVFLNVSRKDPVNPFTPIERELAQPFFYLPIAWNECLPRLLPLDEIRGYAFAVWITSEQSIIWRYIDVDGEKQTSFNGKPGRYTIVRDRIGYEGNDTYHYFDSSEKYLGWETPAQKLRWVVSDEATLVKMYPGDSWAQPKLLEGMNLPVSGDPVPTPPKTNELIPPSLRGR